MQPTRAARQLRSLVPAPRFAVIGASGGIVRAFVESLACDCPAGTVHGLSRSPQESGGEVHHHFIDITEEESIRAAAETGGFFAWDGTPTEY